MIFADEQEAQVACEWWQGQMGLVDWDIKVKYARSWELGEWLFGDIETNLEHKTATIRLLDPVDTRPDFCTPPDHEQTLVHELEEANHRRIRLQVERSQDMNWNFEQAYNRSANALVHLRRLAYPKPPWRVQ